MVGLVLHLSIGFVARDDPDGRYAQLFYSRRGQTIAVGIDRDRPGPAVSRFVVTPHRRSGSATIASAGAFFEHFDLDPEQYVGRYVPRKIPARDIGIDQDGDVFVIDLNQHIARAEGRKP